MNSIDPVSLSASADDPFPGRPDASSVSRSASTWKVDRAAP